MTLYMPLFRSCKTLESLAQLHGHLCISGLHKDPLASTKLVESYAQMGSLRSSAQVFHAFPNPDSFMWGVLVKSFAQNHLFEETMALYHEMVSLGVRVNRYVYPSVLRAFASFSDGGKVHGRIVKAGFDDDAVIQTSLLAMYGELGCLESAQKVFDRMLVRDIVSWSSIIACLVRNGKAGEGLATFYEMVSEGIGPDSITMLSLVDACGDSGLLRLGKSVHSYVVTRSLSISGALGNSLITMYSKCGGVDYAETAFRQVDDPTAASWTALISGYNQTGCFRKALSVYEAMWESGIEPNSVTLTGILRSCSGLRLLREGKSIHCFAFRKALDFDVMKSALLELYAGFQRFTDCEKILMKSEERNILPWNVLMSCYARHGFLMEVLLIFRQMQIHGILPDSYGLSSSLSAVGNLGIFDLGFQIHCHVIKRGYFDEYVQNSLIDMHCKCGFVDKAFTIFDELERKSVVAWNCMIGGFLQSGYAAEGIDLFDRMFFNGHKVDEVTFLHAVQACSQLGYLEKGKWVHHKIITCGASNDIYLNTALIDMYAKCGQLRTAQRGFDAMPERNIVSWSVMISGYGLHGKIDCSISLFTQMLESGIRPNEVTFMNILSACSHSGSVEKGKFYFGLMKDFHIEPNTEHFACIVDLLSRAGDLHGAYAIIKSMAGPVEASIWGSLVNGCRIHHRPDMLHSIRKEVSSVRSDDPGYYALLSNVYAEGGNWDEFGKVRSDMEGIGLKKVPGFSAIEL